MHEQRPTIYDEVKRLKIFYDPEQQPVAIISCFGDTESAVALWLDQNHNIDDTPTEIFYVWAEMDGEMRQYEIMPDVKIEYFANVIRDPHPQDTHPQDTHPQDTHQRKKKVS